MVARRRALGLRSPATHAKALAWWVALILGGSTALPAHALEPGEVAGEPLRLDITNASSLLVNLDNRDTQPNQVNTLANDHWSMWYNRLNVQLNWGKWRAGSRLDTAVFGPRSAGKQLLTTPDPTQIGLDLVKLREPLPGAEPDSVYFRRKVQEAGVELSNRYINWIYPAKYYLGYSSRDVEVTGGDFYAQLGRGLVLSVRKSDELASDTTVRGVRVTGKIRSGDLRLTLTGLGGTMNPLRIDESSGRYLGVDSSVSPGLVRVTEAGMPRAIETDFVPGAESCAQMATCTYAPDQLVGGQVEARIKKLKLGTQATVMMRQDADPTDAFFTPMTDDPVRAAKTLLTASQFLDLPDLGGKGSAYVEVALQSLDHDEARGARSLSGHAVYGSLSLVEKPVALLLEGKHYRRFFPLQANVKLARARELSLVQYSAPPTTVAFWTDTEYEGFNTCVTGGRAKGDLHLGRDESIFAWVGRYHTWAESVSNTECVIDDANLNRVWDLATGAELVSQERKSRANLTVGFRLDETDREIQDVGSCVDPLTGGATTCVRGTTQVYYQEAYLRYDVIRWLSGPFSLQLQGWHRRRRQTLGAADDPWLEGQHLTGVEWSPHFSAALGVEYDTNPQTPDMYYNGQLAYRPSTDSSISLFVGQRRGALRCVAGVCRVFPPFEGGRLDATFRF